MSRYPRKARSRVTRIKIVIEEIAGRHFWQIDGGDIHGGVVHLSSAYVALSDYMISKARLHNPEAKAELL